MNDRKKIFTTTSTLRNADGEVVGYSSTTSESDVYYSERYVYRYENEWIEEWLKSLRSYNSPKVLYELTKRLEFGSAEFHLDLRTKEEIQMKYGLSKVSLYAALNELEEWHIIFRGSLVNVETGVVEKSFGRGVIFLNPYVAWRGTGNDRAKAISEFEKYVKLKKA